MPNLKVSPELVKEWQLSPVSQALFRKLKHDCESLKGVRPFTNGDPFTTYSDIVRVETQQQSLENILPLFFETPEEVAEQLNYEQDDFE